MKARYKRTRDKYPNSEPTINKYQTLKKCLRNIAKKQKMDEHPSDYDHK
jgi:hypothetical protein